MVSAGMSQMSDAHSAGLRRAVRLAGQVGAKARPAGGAARQERLVLAPGVEQRVAQRQHQRGIGARPDGQPFGTRRVVEVAAPGRDVDPGRTVAQAPQPRGLVMPHDARRGDLGRAGAHAAEGGDEPGILRHPVPGRRPILHLAVGHSEEMREHHLGRRVRVGLAREDEAAGEVEEPAQLRLRVVEAPGARPAVGAGEDRAVAMRLAHPRHLARGEASPPRPSRCAQSRRSRARPRRRRRANPCGQPGRGCGSPRPARPRASLGRQGRGRDRRRRGAGRRRRSCRRPSGRRL